MHNRSKQLVIALTLCVAAVSSAALLSCEDSNQNNYNNIGQPDADADADTDADTDADADADTDADADSDTDADDPCAQCAGFLGVDLLVVVDNSLSMIEEQQIMATGFYTLINSLVNPTADWPYPQGANDVRVAVVSTDMGFQYGGLGNFHELPDFCAVAWGDDGLFKTTSAATIAVQSNQIKCDADASQCPSPEWACVNGVCVAPATGNTVNCPPLAGGAVWAETTAAAPNTGLATQVSCLAQLGTAGCGIEQQLQAGVRALTHPNQQVFVRDGYLLSVIVVSDEEDCSIKDPGLFNTPEWTGDSMNTACNVPTENETNYLFDAQYFYDQLIAVKGGKRNAVVFAAIVGVPDDVNSPCQGTGDTLDACLTDPRMDYAPETYYDENNTPYIHFKPACIRTDTTGKEVTQARPGRRFVKVAQKFGCTGYVYSICNPDWSNAMQEIARLIAQCIVV